MIYYLLKVNTIKFLYNLITKKDNYNKNFMLPEKSKVTN